MKLNPKIVVGIIFVLGVIGVFIYIRYYCPEPEPPTNFDAEREAFREEIDSLENVIASYDSALLRADEQINFWKEKDDENTSRIFKLQREKRNATNYVAGLDADSTLLRFTELTSNRE